MEETSDNPRTWSCSRCHSYWFVCGVDAERGSAEIRPLERADVVAGTAALLGGYGAENVEEILRGVYRHVAEEDRPIFEEVLARYALLTS
jgi:hypothetical protein